MRITFILTALAFAMPALVLGCGRPKPAGANDTAHPRSEGQAATHQASGILPSPNALIESDGWLGIRAKDSSFPVSAKWFMDRGSPGYTLEGVEHAKFIASVGVVEVEPNSPAATAGLKTFDEILMLNGKKIEYAHQDRGQARAFSESISKLRPGTKVILNVWQDAGPARDIVLIVARNPDSVSGTHRDRPPGKNE